MNLKLHTCWVGSQYAFNLLNWYSVSTGIFNGTAIKTSTQNLKEIAFSL